MEKERKKLTMNALVLLEKIVRSCPPTPSNGGGKMKTFLMSSAKKAFEGKLYFDSIIDKFDSIRGNTDSYNVYTDMEKHIASGDVNFFTVMNFFAGDVHINRAIIDKNADVMSKLSQLERDKYAFSHVLIPIFLTNMEKGIGEGYYEFGDSKIFIKNIRTFPGRKKRYSAGMSVLMHYSCIIDEIGDKIAQRMIEKQIKNISFLQVCENLKGATVDHAKMSYDPWCEMITT